MSPAITIDPLPRDRTPITTTLPSVSGSTSSSRPSSSHDEIPVAFIVGGIVAGALLALCVCALWILWGKKIQSEKFKVAKEKERFHQTRVNTLRNSTSQRISRGVTDPLSKSGRSQVTFSDTFISQDKQEEMVHVESKLPSLPRPLKPLHKSGRSEKSAKLPTFTAPPRPPRIRPKMSNLSSTTQATSASMYSTESGEARGRTPEDRLSNLWLLAMDGVRASWASSTHRPWRQAKIESASNRTSTAENGGVVVIPGIAE